MGVAAAWLLLAAVPATAQESRDEITFPVEELAIETAHGRLDFEVEVAREPAQRARGLMFRETLAADAGMLFLYDRAQVIGMWMKNTLIPLDMLFIDRTGIIRHIARNTTPHSTATISSREPVSAVLELNGGAARMFRIESGDRVIHPAFEPAS